jgi:hypothetical protein
LGLKLFGFFLLGFKLLVQLENLRAHPGVFLNQGQVTHPDEQQHGEHDEADDEFRQFAPDAEINVHAAS